MSSPPLAVCTFAFCKGKHCKRAATFGGTFAIVPSIVAIKRSQQESLIIAALTGNSPKAGSMLENCRLMSGFDCENFSEVSSHGRLRER